MLWELVCDADCELQELTAGLTGINPSDHRRSSSGHSQERSAPAPVFDRRALAPAGTLVVLHSRPRHAQHALTQPLEREELTLSFLFRPGRPRCRVNPTFQYCK